MRRRHQRQHQHQPDLPAIRELIDAALAGPGDLGIRLPEHRSGDDSLASGAAARLPQASAPPAGNPPNAAEPRCQVTLYTDGAADPNPGCGGYGVVLLHQSHRRELSGGFRRTTNNRMEILAAIVGLEALKEPCSVSLYSDSQYLVNAMSKGWVRRWRRNGWKRTATEKAKNPDLWERLYQLCQTHQVAFAWVRGHASNRENQRCDTLATEARRRPDLPPDPGFDGTR